MRAIAVLLAFVIFPAVAAETSSASQVQAGPVTAQVQLPNMGKVISTVAAGSYTYIEVSKGDKTVWLAALEVSVKKGDMISYSDGPVTTNFYSKSLNRNFKKVIFVSQVAVTK
jgi:hypothetical protein